MAVEMISQRMRLSPYQTYILEQNRHKYDLHQLTKRGGVLYAPYDDKICVGARECVAKFIYDRAWI